MSKETYIEIGRTQKPHGVKGAIKVKIKEEYQQDFAVAKVLFLELEGVNVPYFIAKITEGKEWVLEFEEVDSKEKAYRIASKKISIREKDMIPESDRKEVESNLDFGFLKGYILEDETVGIIGEIEEVVEFPKQEMAFVTYQDREVMIPLNTALLKGIDEKNKVVYADLPEGLLDL